MLLWIDWLDPGHYQRSFYGTGGRLEERFVHVDNPSGTYRSWTRYDARGNFGGRNEERFTERGALVEKIRTNVDNTVAYHWTFTYDDRGNMIEQASLNADGTLKYNLVTQYEYDERGNWITKTTLGWSSKGEPEQRGSDFMTVKVLRRTITYY